MAITRHQAKENGGSLRSGVIKSQPSKNIAKRKLRNSLGVKSPAKIARQIQTNQAMDEGKIDEVVPRDHAEIDDEGEYSCIPVLTMLTR